MFATKEVETIVTHAKKQICGNETSSIQNEYKSNNNLINVQITTACGSSNNNENNNNNNNNNNQKKLKSFRVTSSRKRYKRSRNNNTNMNQNTIAVISKNNNNNYNKNSNIRNQNFSKYRTPRALLNGFNNIRNTKFRNKIRNMSPTLSSASSSSITPSYSIYTDKMATTTVNKYRRPLERIYDNKMPTMPVNMNSIKDDKIGGNNNLGLRLETPATMVTSSRCTSPTISLKESDQSIINEPNVTSTSTASNIFMCLTSEPPPLTPPPVVIGNKTNISSSSSSSSLTTTTTLNFPLTFEYSKSLPSISTNSNNCKLDKTQYSKDFLHAIGNHISDESISRSQLSLITSCEDDGCSDINNSEATNISENSIILKNDHNTDENKNNNIKNKIVDGNNNNNTYNNNNDNHISNNLSLPKTNYSPYTLFYGIGHPCQQRQQQWLHQQIIQQQFLQRQYLQQQLLQQQFVQQPLLQQNQQNILQNEHLIYRNGYSNKQNCGQNGQFRQSEQTDEENQYQIKRNEQHQTGQKQYISPYHLQYNNYEHNHNEQNHNFQHQRHHYYYHQYNYNNNYKNLQIPSLYVHTFHSNNYRNGHKWRNQDGHKRIGRYNQSSNGRRYNNNNNCNNNNNNNNNSNNSIFLATTNNINHKTRNNNNNKNNDNNGNKNYNNIAKKQNYVLNNSDKNINSGGNNNKRNNNNNNNKNKSSNNVTTIDHTNKNKMGNYNKSNTNNNNNNNNNNNKSYNKSNTTINYNDNNNHNGDNSNDNYDNTDIHINNTSNDNNNNNNNNNDNSNCVNDDVIGNNTSNSNTSNNNNDDSACSNNNNNNNNSINNNLCRTKRRRNFRTLKYVETNEQPHYYRTQIANLPSNSMSDGNYADYRNISNNNNNNNNNSNSNDKIIQENADDAVINNNLDKNIDNKKYNNNNVVNIESTLNEHFNNINDKNTELDEENSNNIKSNHDGGFANDIKIYPDDAYYNYPYQRKCSRINRSYTSYHRGSTSMRNISMLCKEQSSQLGASGMHYSYGPFFCTKHNISGLLSKRGLLSDQAGPSSSLSPYRSLTPQEIESLPATPADRYLARSHLVELKVPPENLLTNAIWNQLSVDIWSMFVKKQQSQETYKKKMCLWRYLYLLIKGNFNRGIGVYMVGSTITGFGNNSSDVDICLVVHEESELDARTDAINHLQNIMDFLEATTASWQGFQLIRARVPILRFIDTTSSIEVDINFNNCVGIRNTQLLYFYTQLEWRVRPIAVIVKSWAQYHDINDAKNRTISSYSLALMIIHFLQCGVVPAVLPCLHLRNPSRFKIMKSQNDLGFVNMLEQLEPYQSQNKQTLGELLVEFFKYYSKFDYQRYAISVRKGSVLNIEDFRTQAQNDLDEWQELCIEEPFNLTNTARSVYDGETFIRIKSVFYKSWKILERTKDLKSVFCDLVWNEDEDDTAQGTS